MDEVTGPSLRDEFKPVTPAHPSPSSDNVDHTLDGAVMMSSRGSTGVNIYRPGPEKLRAMARSRNRGSSIHPQRLRRVGIQLVRMHNVHTLGSPTLRIAHLRIRHGITMPYADVQIHR
jgi:hypothetical protein